MTKARIPADLRSARSAWEALLAEVGEERMEEPGVEGQWSVKKLTDPQRYEWAQGSPLWRYIAGNSYKHYAEHSEAICAWLDREPAGE